MPTYVYICEENHEKTVYHGMKDDPCIVCHVCKNEMHRKPQSFRWGWSASDTLFAWSEDNYYRHKAGKPIKNQHKVNRP